MSGSKEKDEIIEFTFGLDAPEIEDSEKLQFTKNLLPELRGLDEVNRAERAKKLAPEADSKPGFETLLGVLTAEVSLKNVKKFLGFLGDRLKDKPIKGTIKMGDNIKEIQFEVKSRQELAEFEKTALKLIEAMRDEKDE